MVGAFAFATLLATPDFAWRNVGPAGGGGRVAAVAGSDDDALLYYFGAAGGGVFKTTNGGLTWNDVWPSSSVGALGAIAVAPSDPNVVYAGTGEAAPRNDASYGDGIWVTTDAAKHWTHRGLEDTYAIARIVVDPRDSRRALAGALGNPFRDSSARGVYLTTDGGRTWQHTLYPGPQSGISDLALDRAHPNVVYAGVWQFRRLPWTFTSGGSVDGIYKSTDFGRTWRKLSGSGLPQSTMGRIGIAVAPSDSRRVYALIQSREGLLWRSDDAGAHWRMMSRDTLVDQRPFYMSRLEVDPVNRDHVFFASENLIETRDGGRTLIDDHNALHQDHHGFWISRDGKRIIEADDGGAPISLDGGRSWDWRYNVVLAQVYHLGYDEQRPYTICGALQDNDSFCAPNLSLSPIGLLNGDWRDVANNSDGVVVWPEPGHPELIWNAGVNELNGQLGIYDMRSRQNYDITPDVTDTNGRALAGLPHRFNWESPLAFSPLERGAAFFGANVLFKTTDSGRTWREISPDLTRNDPKKQQLAGGPINTDISGAEFYDTLLDIGPSPVDANVIWTGSDDGVISLTRDGATSWSNVSPPSAGPWGRVECVEPSRVSATRAYAVIDRHLLGDRRPYVVVTDDAGRTWHSISAGLPSDEMARAIREDPFNTDVLYAGLEQGVWFSLDRGMHWEPLRLRMPPVSVYDLRVQPQTHDLLAASHGRGLFILDDVAPIEGLARARASQTPTLFPVQDATSWYYWWTSTYPVGDDACCAPQGTFAAVDPPYGAWVTYYLPQKLAQPPVVTIVDQNARVVRTLTGTNERGINRVAWSLSDAPPVRWHNTGDWNKGPDDGPAVVPGRYRVIWTGGDARLERDFAVLPDPRTTWSQDDYVARYTLLKTLDDELSEIDVALNRLDAARARASGAQLRAIDAVYRQLTSGVRNAEDDQWMPDRLRERLTILQGTLALSQGPPLPPHLREAAAVRAEFDQTMRAYHALGFAR
jgi:photosystem II stability/assembly factor-like uncharacterized protein